ncbi:hypothetical protein CMT56_13885 [Elizabethkingia anophelis]|nr:hypothetical protein [Elizabethkingia anophelis]MDV3860902.1 hypothetical protein [Elizabethkingia anophelis]MDV3909350.1 hypothetical protein [Elizabethkingia anophelis]MDV3922808.1 hypothetical protein [Elizabethkingia anophelis]MDV3989105.1 hypothetical protein [Elizabethkingia anophelis]
MNINYLFTNQDKSYKLPVEMKLMELPLKEMSWENFERLCLRLVKDVDLFKISECDIFGRKGQKQEGIDIFARKGVNQYYTYQCKRYIKITNNDLKKFFEEFEAGDWKESTTKFHLCTTADFDDIHLQRDFEKIKDDFAKQNIDIVRWDKRYFNDILKDFPLIVYDFFGKEWCVAFCGQEKYEKEINNTRLDANSVALYKNILGKFYSDVFNTYDKGLSSFEENTVKIENRFVMPDCIIESKNSFYSIQQEKQEEQDKKPSKIELPYQIVTSNYYFPDVIKKKETDLKIEKSYVRKQLDEEISDNSLIIADAGYGKSTFLRFLLLNILCEFENSSSIIKKKFGECIPVYIPFAYYTSKLKENNNYSLLDILKLWFNGFDKQDLFKIVSKAFNDERLLLIVDGVDEYTSINLAQIILDKLNVYKKNHNIKTIFSSRPYGYKVLKEFIPSKDLIYLAPLSQHQQKEIVQRWLIHNKIYQDRGIGQKYINDFFKELLLLPDLKELSEIPLLLNILLAQKLNNLSLPRDKFSAYEEIIEHLINKHFQKRVIVANAFIEDSLDELREYWGDIFSKIALEFQSNSFDGILTKDDVKKIVSDFLQNELGYLIERGTRVSGKFIEFSINSIGILIEKSSKELAFIHRQFQEFLSAEELRKKDDDEILKYLSFYSDNLQWEQTILFFFYNVKKNRQFEAYLQCIKDKNILLYFKISLTVKNCPLHISVNSFNEVEKLFVDETRSFRKDQLLEIILSGIYNPKLEKQYFEFINKYIPNVYEYSDHRINAINEIEEFYEDERIVGYLFDILLNGDLGNKLNVSSVLKKACKNIEIKNRLIELANKCPNLEVRAFAFQSIINNNVPRSEISKLIKDYYDCPFPLLAMTAMEAKIFLKEKVLVKELDKMLLISNKISKWQLENKFFWIFTDGWGKSKKLKALCLESLNEERNERENDLYIDKDLAWLLLFHNFNKEEDVINLVIKQFESKYPFYVGPSNDDLYTYVATYFKDNDRVVDAVYLWLSIEDTYFYPNHSKVCYISRDIRIKDLLISRIQKKDSISYWDICYLVEIWGGNVDVITFLQEQVRSKDCWPNMAILIPSIFGKNEAIETCEKILFGKDHWRAQALEPMIKLDPSHFEKMLLVSFINNELSKYSKEGIYKSYWEAISVLIKYFPNSKYVKDVINENSDSKHLFLYLMIKGNSIKTEEIYELINFSLPLNEELRRKIANKVGLVPKFLNSFENLNKESSNSCRTILLYNYLKNNTYEAVADEIENLSNYRGEKYYTNVAIGFLGAILHDKFGEFTTYRKNANNESFLPIELYFSTRFNEELFKFIDIHFDYIAKNIDNDFEHKLLGGSNSEIRNIDFFSLLINHHSEEFNSKPYIYNFIKNNSALNSIEFLFFLIREYTDDVLTINAVENAIQANQSKAYNSSILGIIIGEKYSGNEHFKKILLENKSNNPNLCIPALLIGWSDEVILKDYHERMKNDEFVTNDKNLIYLLLILFYNAEDLIEIFDSIEENKEEVMSHQPYFINPLLFRVKEDEKVKEYIFKSLEETTSGFMIVLYSSLLQELNYKNPEYIDWKNEISLSENFYTIIGYNIIDNKYQALSELIS